MQKFIGKKKMKIYKKYDREIWAVEKLNLVKDKLPNQVLSDIGSGFGWFEKHAIGANLDWQPFDYVKKIEKSIIWDLNNPAPAYSKKPGLIVFLEVLEHLSNPELGLRNISNHILKDGYLLLSVPYIYSAQSKFEFLLKNKFYAFQEKHLSEHHVFVPLPHVVKFHLENNGFEIIEMATLGIFKFPKFRFSFSFLKSILHFILVKFFILLNPESEGNTLAIFAKKVN